MPGRKFSAASGYRYGFNTQERSTEINENSYTAEFWQYDSRIGRRWNVDPVPNEAISPYATNNNSPIVCLDPDGDFPIIGFVIGFVADIAMQAVINVAKGKKPFEEINITSAIISGFSGAFTGGLSSLTGAMSKGVAKTTVQAVGEVTILATESVAKQTLVEKKEASLEQTLSDVGSDLAGGFLFKKVLGDGLDASAAINTKNANIAQGEVKKMMSGGGKVGKFQGASYANTKGLNQIAKTENAAAKLKTVTSEAISEVSRNTTQEASNNIRKKVKENVNSNNTPSQTNKPKVSTKTKSANNQLKFITKTRADGSMMSVPDNEYGRRSLKEFMKGNK